MIHSTAFGTELLTCPMRAMLHTPRTNQITPSRTNNHRVTATMVGIFAGVSGDVRFFAGSLPTIRNSSFEEVVKREPMLVTATILIPSR